ncbi:hypothetical protein BaRGS_00009219 [Batillaria attramentaria]|uniref:BTB domain-containing protein n=1 Tax=Batillaria attramentaria TaxID=370345 RepID=A0ABD0LJT8_9CAEN
MDTDPNGEWPTTRCVCSLCKNNKRTQAGRRYFAQEVTSRDDSLGCSVGPSLEDNLNSHTSQDRRKEWSHGNRQEAKVSPAERRRSGSVPETLLDCLHCGKDSFPPESLQSRVHQRRSAPPSGFNSYGQPSAFRGARSRLYSSAPVTSCRQWSNEQRRNPDIPCRHCSNFDTPREATDDEFDVGGAGGFPSASRPYGDQVRSTRPPRRNWSSDFDDADATDFSVDGDHAHGGGDSPEKTYKPRGLPVERNSYSPLRKSQTDRRRSSNADEITGRECLTREKQKFVDFNDTHPRYGDEGVGGCYDADNAETMGRFCDINENRRRQGTNNCLHCHRPDTKFTRPRRFSDPGPCPHNVTGNVSSSFDPGSMRYRCTTNNANAADHCTTGSHRRASNKQSFSQVESMDSILSSEIDADDDNRTGESSMNESGHPNGLLMANLCDMWRRHRLCDAVLRVDGQEFPVHRLAIAAFSNTFARRYCEGEARTAPLQLDVTDTSPGGLQQVLRFVYTGVISLSPDNIGDVLGAAAFLHINHVTALCQEVLLQPSVETVIYYSQLAEKYHLIDDTSRFYDFVCEHFLRVSRTPGWRSLGFGQVFDYLNEDNLNVERELDVFHAAVSWIEADRPHRMSFAADLIGCVRFAFITPDEIAKHVETRQFLFHGDEGKELLLCIYRHHALQTCGCKHGPRLHRLPRRKYMSPALQRNKNSSAFSRVRPAPTDSYQSQRHSSGHPVPVPSRPGVILAVGGVNPFQLEAETQVRQVEQFNPRSNHWTTLTRLPDGRHHHGAIVLGGALYVIGGSVLDELNPGHLCNPTASCYRYQTVGGQWSAISSLNVPRMYHATAVLNGLIFVVAGQTHHTRHLTSLEFYRSDVDEWESGSEVGEARIGVALAAYRGMLFAVGGFLETQNEHVVRGTVEVYDHRTRRWKTRTPLPTPRCHAGLAVCGGKLYLIGGSTFPLDSSSVCSLASVLRYDDVDDRWDRIQTLRTPRHDMGVAVLGKILLYDAYNCIRVDGLRRNGMPGHTPARFIGNITRTLYAGRERQGLVIMTLLGTKFDQHETKTEEDE